MSKCQTIILCEPHAEVQKKLNQWQSSGFNIAIIHIQPVDTTMTYIILERTQE